MSFTGIRGGLAGDSSCIACFTGFDIDGILDGIGGFFAIY